MIKVARVVENADFRTIDIHLHKKSYSIKITEQEIDEEAKKYGIDPVRQRLYACPVNRSRNMLATDIAERKLLGIMEDELLGVKNDSDYIIKDDNDLSRFLWKRYEGEI